MLNFFNTSEFSTIDVPVAKIVPEGQPTIAQRFSVGLGRPPRSSPEGTAEKAAFPAQPSLRDWFSLLTGHPTLKRWAIVKHPFGMSLEAVHSIFEEI